MKVGIIGLGLIGGSLAKGLIKSGVHVNGYDLSEHTRELAHKDGIEIYLSTNSLARNCDVIVICTPISAVEDVLYGIRDHLKPDAIITDACSVKETVFDIAKEVLNEKQLSNFIPGHPISGKETSGFEVAESSLFLDKRVVLSYTEVTNKKSLLTIRQMWKDIGAFVEMMDMSHHDEMFALTSHLPHMLTYAMMETMHNNCEDITDALQYTGGGFKDFIRIAKSDPTMWSDIAIGNKKPLLKWMKLYQQTLTEMIDSVESDDKDSLYEVIERSKNNLM